MQKLYWTGGRVLAYEKLVALCSVRNAPNLSLEIGRCLGYAGNVFGSRPQFRKFMTIRTNSRIGTAVIAVTVIFATSAPTSESQLLAEGDLLHSALLPKAETGASSFLAEYPEFDGRNVSVAIFDTGVDPGAPALSTTPDGQQKFIDLIDATGDGDVSLTEPRKSAEGRITGVTTRILMVSPDWNNPTGEYRLGMKSAWELFPPELVDRLKEQRRTEWMKVQRERLQQLRKSLSDESAELSKKERQARVDALQHAIDHYEDLGPVYDCVVFHDGNLWRAVVDTDEDGDLAEETVLTDFDKEPKFATFGNNSSLNFSVHIYDEGKTLSLVTVSGEHGTHVAGIVAAYDPNRPERNGVAPGARLISVKIGDNRIDGMETGKALTRAFPAMIRHKVDLINMSYGEPGSPANSGRIVEHLSSLVREHGVIFVGSAGNAGPALSTVGAPGGTSSALYGVGAYVSPAMMQSQYTVRDEIPGVAYTWTSRGPTTDGAFGVDIFAPGGAVAPIPNYSLQPSRQMNGTSMASPNACGCIALLLSGLKSKSIPYNHISILRALQNTASIVESTDRFAQGAGLIQIPDAFNYLTSEAATSDELIEIDVDVPGHQRGIYLREAYESTHVYEPTLFLKPRFIDGTSNERQLAYEIPLRLEATADWVDVGPLMMLAHDGRPMSVQVDPTGLEPGVHFAEIIGYDDRNPDRGPLVRIPVTVVRSEETEHGHIQWQDSTQAGNVVRHFVQAPATSHSATLKIRRIGGDSVRMGFVHLVQLGPGQTFEKGEQQWMVRLDADEEVTQEFSVIPGRVMEVCWGHYWPSLGEGDFTFDLTFHGVTPSERMVSLSPGISPRRFDVAVSLNPAQVEVQGGLTTHRRLLAPVKHDTQESTSERDQLPDFERSHSLTLSYNVNQESAGNVFLRFASLEGLLYESPLGGLLMTIRDEHGRVIGTQDMFADEPTRLSAGQNTVELELRHTDPAVLRKFESLPLCFDQPLGRTLKVPVGGSPAQLAAGESRVTGVELQPGQIASVWLGAPALDGVKAEPGDLLLGELTTSPQAPGLKIPVEMSVTPVAARASDAKVSKAFDGKLSADDAYNEFLYERLAALQYPANKEEIDSLVAQLRERKPHDRRTEVALLHLLDTYEHREEHLELVVEAANRVLKTIPRPKVQSYFGNRNEPETAEEKQLHEERTAQRKDLIDALYRKGRALGYMELPEVVAKHPIADQAKLDEEFAATFKQLTRWVDTEEPDYILLHDRKLRREGNFGQAIKLLQKDIARPKRDDWLHHKKLRDMYEALGWSDWRDYEQRLMRIRFPNDKEE